MNRRGFLKSVIVSALVAPLLPRVVPKPSLAFHPDAFSFVMAPLRMGMLRAGETFTVEGVYLINPETGA